MSATNRRKKTKNQNETSKTKREENDFYPTPQWAVHRFLEKAEHRLPQNGVWLEPCAGEGAIIKAIRSSNTAINNVTFNAVELQEQFQDVLKQIKNVDKVYSENFLSWSWFKRNSEPIQCVITNPPYILAHDIIKHSLSESETVCMLLRINFLASETRCEWMQAHTPDLYVLPNRPSFRGKGTDACEYAWFVWDRQSTGKVVILDTTPKSIRMAEKRKLSEK